MTPEKRVRQLAHDTAEEFKSTILHNRVSEQVRGGHTRHPDLLRVIQLAEGAYDLSEDRDDDVVGTAAFRAAEKLNDQIDALVDEAIAEACRVIICETDDWTDTWDQAEIDAARREAREWLQSNLDAAERAGVLDDLEVRA